MQPFTLTMADGARVAARRYTPGPAALGSVVIGGAMGVRQDYYAPFAEWLAEQGWQVTRFDYRGHGDSLALGPPLRACAADLNDWARDYEAVVTDARTANPQGPLLLLGHSLGAQLPGFFQRPDVVDGLLSVAAGSGYWRENAPRLKRLVPYFWWVLVPIATRLVGYFPGRRLRKVGDLPRGVMLQWRRWCLNREYSVGAEGPAARASYASVKFPVLALSVADDELMTLQGTRSLLRLFSAAPSQVQRIEPAQLGLRRIGHFGWFRPSGTARLWPLAEQALRGLPQRAAKAQG